MLISNVVQRGIFKGIGISLNYFLTHFLFVDEIIIFSDGIGVHRQSHKDFLDILCQSTCMIKNSCRSSIFGYGRKGKKLIC